MRSKTMFAKAWTKDEIDAVVTCVKAYPGDAGELMREFSDRTPGALYEKVRILVNNSKLDSQPVAFWKDLLAEKVKYNAARGQVCKQSEWMGIRKAARLFRKEPSGINKAARLGNIERRKNGHGFEYRRSSLTAYYLKTAGAAAKSLPRPIIPIKVIRSASNAMLPVVRSAPNMDDSLMLPRIKHIIGGHRLGLYDAAEAYRQILDLVKA